MVSYITVGQKQPPSSAVSCFEQLQYLSHMTNSQYFANTRVLLIFLLLLDNKVHGICSATEEWKDQLQMGHKMPTPFQLVATNVCWPTWLQPTRCRFVTELSTPHDGC